MLFMATMDQRSYQIEVLENPREWQVTLTDIKTQQTETHTLSKTDYQQFGELISFLFKHRSYLIDIVQKGDDYTVFTKGAHKTIQLLSEERQLHKKLAGGDDPTGEKLIKSGMPGKVMEVRVQPGDKVQEGDLLLTLSAMKMENEIRSDISAKVQKVFVTADQNVETGTPLLSLASLK